MNPRGQATMKQLENPKVSQGIADIQTWVRNRMPSIERFDSKEIPQ